MVVQLGTALARIALSDPLSTVLLAVGASIMGAIGLVSAYVGLGALFELVTPTSR